VANAKDLTLGNIYQRVNNAAAAVGVVGATGRNATFNYSFVEEAKIVAAVREQFYKFGVLLRVNMLEASTSLNEVTGSSGKTRTENRAFVKLELEFVNVDEPADRYAVFWSGEAADSGDKAINKAVVSALKYALLKNLLIPKEGDDTEADATTDDRIVEKVSKKGWEPVAKAPENDDERNAARLAAYSAMKKAGHRTDGPSVKGYAIKTLGRNIGTLYALTKEDWTKLANSVESGRWPDADDSIPF
jgi:hypothetical protein